MTHSNVDLGFQPHVSGEVGWGAKSTHFEGMRWRRSSSAQIFMKHLTHFLRILFKDI